MNSRARELAAMYLSSKGSIFSRPRRMSSTTGYFPAGRSSSSGTTKGFRTETLMAREESNLMSALSL